MHFTNLACWVIEVLSETTEAIDRSEKLQNYTAIPALIVLCFGIPEQTLDRTFRAPEGRYISLGPVGVLKLLWLDLSLEVRQIYLGVKF